MKKVSRINMLILALSLAFSPARAVDWEKVGFGAAITGGIALLAGLVWWANAPETNEHMLSPVQEDYDITCWRGWQRMKEIDLAIQQMAFKAEQKEELKRLKKERRRLEQLLNVSRA